MKFTSLLIFTKAMSLLKVFFTKFGCMNTLMRKTTPKLFFNKTNRQMHKSINLRTHKTSHNVKLSCELPGVHYCISPPGCTRVKCVHTQELLWPQAQCQNHCTSKIFPSFGKISHKSVRLHGMLHLVNYDQFVNINYINDYHFHCFLLLALITDSGLHLGKPVTKFTLR